MRSRGHQSPPRNRRLSLVDSIVRPRFYTISSLASLVQTGRFATCARLVLSDRRGRDPDRSAAGECLDLAALALDVKAVLDARVWSLGVMFGARGLHRLPISS